MERFFDMPKFCSECQLNFVPEPGFYYGAMYVSYALSITIVGIVWAILSYLEVGFWTVIWTVIPVLLLSIPYLFKVSRIIWINFFVHFDKNAFNDSEKIS